MAIFVRAANQSLPLFKELHVCVEKMEILQENMKLCTGIVLV